MKSKRAIARTEEEKKKKRNAIIQCAMTLFIEKGFYKTTIDEIAREMGVAKGSVYSYFKSKEDILFSIAETVMGGFDEICQQIDKADISAVKKIERLAEQSFLFYEKNTDICRMILKLWGYSDNSFSKNLGEWTRSAYSEFRTFLERILKQGIKENQIKKNIDVKRTASMILAMMDGLMLQWIYEPELFSTNRCLKTFRKLFLEGLLN